MGNLLLNNNVISAKLGSKDANIYIGDKLISRFRLVEYISSTATGGQYIDLGCKLLENTDDIRIDIKFNITGHGKTGKQQSTLIASQSEVNPYPGFTMRIAAIDINNSNTVNFITKWMCSEYWGSYVDGGKTRYGCTYMSPKLNSGNPSISGGTFTYTNQVYEYSILLDQIPDSQINDFSCHLFCALDSSNQPFRYIAADLYYLKITKGGQVIRDLIPVYDLVSKEYGLYDKLNKVFYKSLGDEPFIAGLEI